MSLKSSPDKNIFLSMNNLTTPPKSNFNLNTSYNPFVNISNNIQKTSDTNTNEIINLPNLQENDLAPIINEFFEKYPNDEIKFIQNTSQFPLNQTGKKNHCKSLYLEEYQTGKNSPKRFEYSDSGKENNKIFSSNERTIDSNNMKFNGNNMDNTIKILESDDDEIVPEDIINNSNSRILLIKTNKKSSDTITNNNKDTDPIKRNIFREESSNNSNIFDQENIISLWKKFCIRLVTNQNSYDRKKIIDFLRIEKQTTFNFECISSSRNNTNFQNQNESSNSNDEEETKIITAKKIKNLSSNKNINESEKIIIEEYYYEPTDLCYVTEKTFNNILNEEDFHSLFYDFEEKYNIKQNRVNIFNNYNMGTIKELENESYESKSNSSIFINNKSKKIKKSICSANMSHIKINENKWGDILSHSARKAKNRFIDIESNFNISENSFNNRNIDNSVSKLDNDDIDNKKSKLGYSEYDEEIEVDFKNKDNNKILNKPISDNNRINLNWKNLEEQIYIVDNYYDNKDIKNQEGKKFNNLVINNEIINSNDENINYKNINKINKCNNIPNLIFDTENVHNKNQIILKKQLQINNEKGDINKSENEIASNSVSSKINNKISIKENNTKNKIEQEIENQNNLNKNNNDNTDKNNNMNKERKNTDYFSFNNKKNIRVSFWKENVGKNTENINNNNINTEFLKKNNFIATKNELSITPKKEKEIISISNYTDTNEKMITNNNEPNISEKIILNISTSSDLNDLSYSRHIKSPIKIVEDDFPKIPDYSYNKLNKNINNINYINDKKSNKYFTYKIIDENNKNNSSIFSSNGNNFKIFYQSYKNILKKISTKPVSMIKHYPISFYMYESLIKKFINYILRISKENCADNNIKKKINISESEINSKIEKLSNLLLKLKNSYLYIIIINHYNKNKKNLQKIINEINIPIQRKNIKNKFIEIIRSIEICPKKDNIFYLKKILNCLKEHEKIEYEEIKNGKLMYKNNTIDTIIENNNSENIIRQIKSGKDYKMFILGCAILPLCLLINFVFLNTK